MSSLTEHISLEEYACRHCGALPPDFDLNPVYGIIFDIFEDIRNKWGKPIPINSGYRCRNHPESKKNPYSVHVFGLALDLGCKSAAEAKRLFHLASNLYPKLRIGYSRYKKDKTNIIHIDVGFYIDPQFLDELHEGARW